ncbi:mechanosensitive ion channel family protein [Virgisporangium aurantiacum]|uniref:Uncharacterized protein n=1 Tax=Virgisporangium aurantiacum TaxID=175570 RepID=A0A8J3ZJ54_9ACTN|nr:hypothetical protein [Virgisporangium aurantiacum]GIJ62940.1 hypothetical protein Vau01_104560 [Virgisporangium aurantiacum]
MTDILASSTVDVEGGLSDMLRSFLLFLPKALLFLLILVIGFLVARVARRLTDKVLERVGFDRWVERGGIRAALAKSKYDASDIVAKLVYYAILLFTLQLAFGVWGPNPVSDLISGVVAWLPQAFIAIIIVVVAAAIAAAVKDLIANALGGLSYGRLLANVAWIFIIGLGVIAALNQIGVATTVTTPVLIAVLATVAGVIIVGVGGGLVRPMQGRWEAWLDRAAAESQAIAAHAKAYQATQATAAPAAAPAERAPDRAAPVYATGTAATHPATPVDHLSAVQRPAAPAAPEPTQPVPPTQRPISDQPTQVIPPTRDPE